MRDIEPGAVTFDILDTEQRGFLARVTPKGGISYGIRYSNAEGRQCRYSLGKTFPTTTVSAAREEARILLGRIAAGEDPSKVDRTKRQRKLTLGLFLDETYEDWLISNTKTGKARAQLIRAAFPTFLDMPLTEITGWMTEKWRSERLKSGISQSTTNRNITALRGLFSRAKEWKLVDEHPLSKVKMFQEPSSKVRWLSKAEEHRLRRALDAREKRDRANRIRGNIWRQQRNYNLLPDLNDFGFVDHVKPMVLLSINTGLRRGEVLSLRWDAVDFKNELVTVADENSKSGRARHVPLNIEALTVLKTWRKQTPGELVFPGRSGSAITEIKTAWRKLLADAGIDNFRWHDMRHHFASRLVMEGVDLYTVGQLLGHADPKMTGRYAHLAPGHKAAAVQKLTSRIRF